MPAGRGRAGVGESSRPWVPFHSIRINRIEDQENVTYLKFPSCVLEEKTVLEDALQYQLSAELSNRNQYCTAVRLV